MDKPVYLYTDGACKGNPGAGGWGVFMRYGAHEKELFGGEAETTNNRMELTAVIEGLTRAMPRAQRPEAGPGVRRRHPSARRVTGGGAQPARTRARPPRSGTRPPSRPRTSAAG